MVISRKLSNFCCQPPSNNRYFNSIQKCSEYCFRILLITLLNTSLAAQTLTADAVKLKYTRYNCIVSVSHRFLIYLINFLWFSSCVNMSRKCINDPNSFFYVCGEFNFKKQRRNFTKLVLYYYRMCFGFFVCNQDKSWKNYLK